MVVKPTYRWYLVVNPMKVVAVCDDILSNPLLDVFDTVTTVVVAGDKN